MKKKLFQLLSGFFIYTFLVTTFIYFISTTKKANYNTSNFTDKISYYSNENILNVGTFITDSSNIEDSIISFMQNVFITRNSAFLNGNVETLYKFYDTNENFGQYSLKHEFKRIAFLRDISKNKDITLKNIKSIPTIKDIKVKNGIYNLTLSEKYSFDYFYNYNVKEVKNFSIELIHTLELKDYGHTYIISKDYYEDCFKSGLEDYNFDLTENKIP